MAREVNRALCVGSDGPGFMSWLPLPGCVNLGKCLFLSGPDSSSVHLP